MQVCVCVSVHTRDADSALLLLVVVTSLNRELNSLDNSSAVASDAFRSSFIVWTEHKPQEYHRQISTGCLYHENKHTVCQKHKSGLETYTACCGQSLSENSWLWGSSALLLQKVIGEKSLKIFTCQIIILTFQHFVGTRTLLPMIKNKQYEDLYEQVSLSGSHSSWKCCRRPLALPERPVCHNKL